jgi:hypothetical protein
MTLMVPMVLTLLVSLVPMTLMVPLVLLSLLACLELTSLPVYQTVCSPVSVPKTGVLGPDLEQVLDASSLASARILLLAPLLWCAQQLLLLVLQQTLKILVPVYQTLCTVASALRTSVHGLPSELLPVTSYLVSPSILLVAPLPSWIPMLLVTVPS